MNTAETFQNADAVANPSQTVKAFEGLRVLPAEDCPDQGRLYLKFLQSAGAKVASADNGQAADNAVRHSLTLHDPVVMDFQMPALDGLDATRPLRELGYEGTIVAVTAFASGELKESWFRADCNEFLEKPLGRQPLVNAIIGQLPVNSKADKTLQRSS